MFEVLEHTADIGFRASAPSEAAMLEQAALALVSIAVEREGIEPRQVYPIAASGEDPESLLVNWLSEVLYYLDGEHVALCRFEVRTMEGGRVTGQAWGEPRDPQRHRAKLVVKGVTYHQLAIRKKGNEWTCEVFLDI